MISTPAGNSATAELVSTASAGAVSLVAFLQRYLHQVK